MERASWAVLGLLLAATLAGAATHDRSGWPGVVGDEATYLMAAQSLARDGDLRYTPADLARFRELWGVPPDGLILQSTDGGRTLLYGKEAAYPAWIAPFVRLSPARGAPVANALLLALTAIAAARALRARVGPAAPLWVAVWTFASVTFASVFWVHSDLFLACLVALALALVWGGAGEPEPRGAAARWALAGALLALPVLSRPIYGGLLAAVALATPVAARRRALAGLAGGLLAVVLLAAAGNAASRGTWSGYGGDRRSFYSYTGFPGEPGAAPWSGQVAELGDGTHSWLKPETFRMGFDARQTGWNLVYWLAGRHVGVLPYFLPLLLGFAAFRPERGRWALPLAVLAAAAVLFWIRPFNFWGGGGSIANRYFLPLYPALWFLAARPLRGARAWLAPLAAALLAAPFLLPLWRAPRAYPIGPDGGYRWVSSAAARLLPYETTQSHLKPAGQEDFAHHGLWIKPLTPGLRGDAESVRLAAGRPGALLLGSPRPLPAVRVVAPAAAGLEVEGATRLRRPPGRARRAEVLTLRFARPRAVHRMWWTDDPVYLYVVRVAAAGGGAGEVAFRIEPAPRSPDGAPGGGGGGG